MVPTRTFAEQEGHGEGEQVGFLLIRELIGVDRHQMALARPALGRPFAFQQSPMIVAFPLPAPAPGLGELAQMESVGERQSYEAAGEAAPLFVYDPAVGDHHHRVTVPGVGCALYQT